MEGPTALAALAAPATPAALANSPHPQYEQLGMTDMSRPTPQNAARTPAMVHSSETSHNNNNNIMWPDTLAPVYDHGMLSNVRGAMGHDLVSHDGSAALPFESSERPARTDSQSTAAMLDYGGPSSPAPVVLMEEEQPPPTEELQDESTLPEHDAYAAIRFVDCHVLVRTPNFVIMRDQGFKRRWQRQKKDNERRQRARRALENYAREPSHQSEDGRNQDPSSRSGDGENLEGRPARGLLSNYSEHDGPVVYAPSDDEAFEEYEAERVRRRNRKNNNSSTSNSIAPADLHLFGPGFLDAGEQLAADTYVAADGTVRDSREWGSIAVHPRIPEDIMKISRDHLIFHYDAPNGRWLLNIVGNGAFVNDEHYSKGTEDIELHHDDEILIATVNMRFALPQYEASSDEGDNSAEAVLESVEAASELSTSPIRRLAVAFGTDDSDEEDEDEDEGEAALEREKMVAPRKRPLQKLKLKNPKKPAAKKEPSKGKGKGKTPSHQQKDQAGSSSKAKTKDKQNGRDEVKDPGKKSEKSKKPKAAVPESTPAIKTEAEKTTMPPAYEDASQVKPTQASPPAVPMNLDPGSVLAGLEPEQMPEKRKGPGRPPKNGVLSKRDESGVKRKRKEYERKGLEPPELQVLLNEVRKEQREKDAANKALARGEAAPDVPVPSIETEEKAEGEGSLRTIPRESQARDGEPSLLGDGRLSSPKLAQRIKSPSPIKPESAFTEEELKKPNMTYVFIIDDILKNIEGGQADLQTIYDKIQKRWPFYKYRVTSLGWQSSVRHNLLSCERFKEAGKSGKGKMWTINEDHPIDNKKRKPTPTPRHPPANGQMSNNPLYQYGQPGYPQYGQQQYNPQGPYASPYGGGSMPPNGQYPSPNPLGQPRLPNQQAQNPFGLIVTDILAFRGKWIMPLENADKAEFTRREDLFSRVTNYFSSIYHSKSKQLDSPVTLDDDINVEEEPFTSLKAIFEQHNDIFNQAASNPTPATASKGPDVSSSININSNTATLPQQNQAPPYTTPPNSTSSHSVATPQHTRPPPAQAGSYTSQPAGPGMYGMANGSAASPLTMVSSVHAHGSVQQQIGNAVANLAPRPTVDQQAHLQPNIPSSNAQSSMSEASDGTLLQTQPNQAAQQPVFHSSAETSAESLTTTSSSMQSTAPVASQKDAQTSPAASATTADGLANGSRHSAAQRLPQVPTAQAIGECAAGYGTPKAPTPEALSRPPSAGTGAKRGVEEDAFAVQEDHEAKRQRTS